MDRLKQQLRYINFETLINALNDADNHDTGITILLNICYANKYYFSNVFKVMNKTMSFDAD